MKKDKKNFISSKALMTFLSFLGLYLLSSGTSWAIFSYLKEDPVASYTFGDLSGTRSKIDLSLPKTEECPINGKLYTAPEKGIWETRRPIAAIIENHADSRPLEGLNKADVVYEAVAEGGITRHLAIFYCGVSADNVRIAPVRSARVYYINWAAEYGNYPIFVHVGGANNICGDCPGGVKWAGQVDPRVRAIEKLAYLGWRVPQGNDFDTTYDTGYPILFRDPERLGRPIASEHTMVAKTDAIFDEASRRGFAYEDSEGNLWVESYRSWKFADDDPLAFPKARVITFEFWSNKPDYDVKWVYDSGSNSYTRFVGGNEQKDLKSGDKISAKNVVIQFLKEFGPVDKEKHMFYKTVGTGKALIFQNGDVIEASWKKDDTKERTLFTTNDGEEILFVRGEIWIEGLPSVNEVEY